MTEPTRPPERAEDAALVEEIAAIPYEPLLPVEKRLIVASLLLGVALLGLLLWLCSTRFPVPAAPG
jgi:hypothetical protein